MILIVGLGNPGKQYEHTPHNLGFYAVDAFRVAHPFSAWKHDKAANALLSKGTVAKQQVILAKPQTFMNRSGYAAKKLAVRSKIPANSVWMAHDDADLPFGTLRISRGRGSAGHKGVESIIRALKSKDITRFRMGTKPNGKAKRVRRGQRALTGAVLKRFSVAQEKTARELAKTTAQAIESALTNGIPRAMTEYNR